MAIKGLVIDSGIITIIGGCSTKDGGNGISVGMYSSITINGGVIKVTGSRSTEASGGVGISLGNRSTFTINGGTVIAIGGEGQTGNGSAMNKKPVLSGYESYIAVASINHNGSNAEEYDPNKYADYKYFKITPKIHNITVTDANGGTVAAPSEATAGQKVVLTVAPDEGYYAGTIKYNDMEITAYGGVYSFTMPAEDVTITALWVEKDDVVIDETEQTYTYNGTAQTFAIIGDETDGFTVKYQQSGSDVSPENAGAYDVVITWAEDAAYKKFETILQGALVIAKADHIIEGENIPTASRIRRGNKLSDSTITPAELKDADGNVLGTFAWVTPDDEMTETGDFVKQVKFTPTDTNNYNEKTFDVTVNVYRHSSGGGGSSNTTTTTTKNEDGSTTKTTTNKSTGTVTEVTTNTDGSTTTVETKKDGTKVVTETNSDGETTATVEAKKETEVTIPVENADEVTKVVVTDENGNETEVEFEVTDGGVAITVAGNSIVSVRTGHICYAKDFTDVDLNAWYHENVCYVLENGLMKGTATDKFAPNASLTRAMLVTVLYRLEGEPKVSGITSFADLEKGQYYLDAVCWAQINGIVNGTTDTIFAPNDNITREQIAAILYRYAIYKGMDAVNVSENLGFTDADEISEYAISALNWAVGTGLINGYEDNTVRPLNNATRAETAALLERFIETNK